MNIVASSVKNLLTKTLPSSTSLFQFPNGREATLTAISSSSSNGSPLPLPLPLQQQQQRRGIRVRILGGNLDQGLRVMQRKMRVSGVEKLITSRRKHHVKGSEKRVLAKQQAEWRAKSKAFNEKLKTVLINKIKGL